MRKFLFILATLTGAALLGPRPAAAAEGPWCAQYEIGPGSSVERCHFRDFESCRQEITGGNRGFCSQNPRFSAQLQAGPPAGRKPRRTN